jgi:hypothetical protein
MVDFSPDALRARFAELTDEFDALNAPLLALKAERDEKYADLTVAEVQAYDEKIRAANDPRLYEIEMERAAIARALNGKTSVPAADE